ncbi:MAG: hypothetical protein WD059_05610 [Balneolaceae bacterium]
MVFLSYLTIGLFIGWLSRVIVKDRGVKMLPSLGFGVIGALTGTAIVYAIGASGAGFYAVIGALGVLFTVNVFRKKRPIFDKDDSI